VLFNNRPSFVVSLMVIAIRTSFLLLTVPKMYHEKLKSYLVMG
jgi:hypothetical protein